MNREMKYNLNKENIYVTENTMTRVKTSYTMKVSQAPLQPRSTMSYLNPNSTAGSSYYDQPMATSTQSSIVPYKSIANNTIANKSAANRQNCGCTCVRNNTSKTLHPRSIIFEPGTGKLLANVSARPAQIKQMPRSCSDMYNSRNFSDSVNSSRNTIKSLGSSFGDTKRDFYRKLMKGELEDDVFLEDFGIPDIVPRASYLIVPNHSYAYGGH